MNDRDTETPGPVAGPEAVTATPVTPVTPEGGFLRRWSQRKQAVARGEAPPEPVPAAPAPQAAPAPEELPLPDPTTLTLADDFSGFLRAKVPPELKRKAMQHLFSHPHFNEVDMLDVYMEDFNLVPDLAPDAMSLVRHAKAVLDPTPSAAADAPPAPPEASSAVEPGAAPVAEPAPVAAASEPPRELDPGPEPEAEAEAGPARDTPA
jgi:hypothetical protein